jgi:SUKH-3 immunity protein
MFTFSEKSQIILKDMGWFPERKVDPSLWISSMQQVGYSGFDKAGKILENLGGLHSGKVSNSIFENFIVLPDNTKIHFAIHPAFDFIATDTPSSNRDAVPYWKEHPFIKENGLDIFPIGSIRAITTLFVASDGSIFTGEFYAPKDFHGDKQASLICLGSTIDKAVDKLIEQCVCYL